MPYDMNNQGKPVKSKNSLSSLSGWDQNFVSQNALRVKGKADDKKWETSETIARQGAGVFLGYNESDMTPLFKTGMTGKRVK
jgi:hypothetical protein